MIQCLNKNIKNLVKSIIRILETYSASHFQFPCRQIQTRNSSVREFKRTEGYYTPREKLDTEGEIRHRGGN